MTYSSAGSDTNTYINNNGNNPPNVQTLPWPSNVSGVSQGGMYSVGVSNSGTVTATCTWTPATGKTLTTDPPPSQVALIEYATASAFKGPGTGPISVDDGLSSGPGSANQQDYAGKVVDVTDGGRRN